MFNWLDYLLIGFFVFGAVMGAAQGYKWQLYRIGCLILAYILSLLFNNVAGNFLARWINMENRNYLGYAAIFFGTIIITFLIGVMVAKTKIRDVGGGRMLGITLGTAKNVMFCSVLIIYIWLLGTDTERTPINNSIIATKLRTGTTFALYKLPHSFLN